MRKIIIFSAFFMLLVSHSLKGQKIVKIRPQRPNVVIVKPIKTFKNKVWIDGHWKWNKRANNYQWVKRHLTKARANRTWKAGKWQKTPRG